MDVHVEPDLPRISIGEDELKQVLLNILNNAIDAVEESAQRSISISATRQGDRVFIRFDDSGPGFSDLNRAFDPFFTTKPVGKGTGLGLSICYGIIQEAGGEIVLQQQATLWRQHQPGVPRHRHRTRRDSFRVIFAEIRRSPAVLAARWRLSGRLRRGFSEYER